MESCIFQCLEAARKNMDILKYVKQIAGNNEKVTFANYGRIYIMSIAKILYANTSSSKNKVDKKLPFRKHILH